MNLPGDAPYSDRAEGPSGAPQMTQANKHGLVDPLIIRPSVYYGEGPFDPPSSESDEEDGPAVRNSMEDDAESFSLLSGRPTLPTSPGRAERGEPSPHRSPVTSKVRCQRCSSRLNFVNITCAEKYLCALACHPPRLFSVVGYPHWHPRWLRVLWNLVSFAWPTTHYDGSCI
jgi:hypothetical protein